MRKEALEALGVRDVLAIRGVLAIRNGFRRNGAIRDVGALAPESDFAREALAIRNHGVDIPLKVGETGHYAPSVVAFGRGPPCVDRGPKLAESYFAWAVAEKRPDLRNGGLRLPVTEDGLYRFEPPRVFPACTAAAPGDARDESASDPRTTITKLHVNWDARPLTDLNARWWIRRGATFTWGTMWTRYSIVAKFVGPLIRRRMYRLRASPRRHSLMGRSKSTLYFWMILLDAMPWILFPKTRSFSPRCHKNPRRFGESFVAGGWASLTHPTASRQTKVGNGRTRFGQICVQTDELNYNFKERGPIPGFWNDAMALRGEFLTV